MEVSSGENACPRCGEPKIKTWRELDEEQRFLVERLPGSVDFTPGERKKHRFCTRCWYEEGNGNTRTV